ncbi:MAG: hypothetical protein H8E44_36980 [Planctomycetes bacterium]|nr:hypothetical protein [Planctomycetota bacterium]MBL7037526.1 hypothetical protein [Pirellulaceae bacterium]
MTESTLPHETKQRFSPNSPVPEWCENRDCQSDFPPRLGSPPSDDVHNQNAIQPYPDATAELASVERCSGENVLETPFHAGEQRGDAVRADAAFWL